MVRFDLPALKLAEEIQALLLKRHLNPVLRLNSTAAMEYNHYAHSAFRQLTFVPPGEEELYRSLAGLISLLAPESLSHLSSTDPEDIAAVQLARKSLRDILDERELNGELSWTLGLWPTPILAENAGTSLDSYAEQVRSACLLRPPRAGTCLEKTLGSCAENQELAQRVGSRHTTRYLGAYGSAYRCRQATALGWADRS